jgi:hypothetical protein
MPDRFIGCLLGGMIGDVIGAVVEGESPKYLAKTYRNLDQILAQDSVPEILGGKWQVGSHYRRYADVSMRGGMAVRRRGDGRSSTIPWARWRK